MGWDRWWFVPKPERFLPSSGVILVTYRAAVLLTTGLIFALTVYLASGFVMVAPGEVVVVRRLGRVLEPTWGAGLHWGLPTPLERRVRVRTMEVRRQRIGLSDAIEPAQDPGAGEFLTGDLNLVRARAVIQYRIADPIAYAICLNDDQVEPLLKRLAEGSLSRELAGRAIDDVLRTGRAEVASGVRDDLARASDRLGLGLVILGVSLTDARPPSEVAPAFDEAQSALASRDRRIQEADAYRETQLATAQAQATARVENAKAVAGRVTAMAAARAERFATLLGELTRDRRLTIRRLYLDALRDLLPRVRRKLILTADDPIDLSIFGGDDRSP